MLSKQGKAIEAKLKDIVTTDIMQHRRMPREKLNEFLAKLVPDINQKTPKFVPSKVETGAKEGASMTFIPKEPGIGWNIGYSKFFNDPILLQFERQLH